MGAESPLPRLQGDNEGWAPLSSRSVCRGTMVTESPLARLQGDNEGRAPSIQERLQGDNGGWVPPSAGGQWGLSPPRLQGTIGADITSLWGVCRGTMGAEFPHRGVCRGTMEAEFPTPGTSRGGNGFESPSLQGRLQADHGSWVPNSRDV